MTQTLTFTAEATQEVFTGWAIEHLRARGYTVILPDRSGRWETPKQCAERTGLHPFTVTRRIHRWEKMGNDLPVRAGSTGRIIEFQSNTRFDEFLKK